MSRCPQPRDFVSPDCGQAYRLPLVLSTHLGPQPSLPPPPHWALVGPEQSREGGRDGGRNPRGSPCTALSSLSTPAWARESFGEMGCHSLAGPPLSPEIHPLPPAWGSPPAWCWGLTESPALPSNVGSRDRAQRKCEPRASLPGKGQPSSGRTWWARPQGLGRKA